MSSYPTTNAALSKCCDINHEQFIEAVQPLIDACHELEDWMHSDPDRVLGKLLRLQHAATVIYEAAHWTADRPVDEVALWTELRDALGRDPGGAPTPLPRQGNEP